MILAYSSKCMPILLQYIRGFFFCICVYVALIRAVNKKQSTQIMATEMIKLKIFLVIYFSPTCVYQEKNKQNRTTTTTTTSETTIIINKNEK